MKAFSPVKVFSTVLLGSAILLIVDFSQAQDTQTKYRRKSISYIDAILPIGENIMLTPQQEKALLTAVQQEIEMSRFDYNPLPDGLLTRFKHEARARGLRDLDSFAAAMNDILVPEILSIVDMKKEMRARELVSEADRHSFVVEKAKEKGITAQDLEAIMNSAYIYIPVLSEVKEYDYAATNTINYDLRGGIIWFAVKTDEAGTKVELLVKKEAVGKGAARRNASINYKGRELSGPEYAFFTAAEVLARNLKIATQEIPEFQLANPITETGSGWVEFGMGKKEGLGVDDKFIISEFYEETDGSLTQKKLGMVRVSRVADNRQQDADSRARPVIGGGYERGMVALEHPRLPIDLSFRLGILPLSMTKGSVEYFFPGYYLYPDLDFPEDATGTIMVGQLWFNYNLARSTNVSQLFVSIYGEFGGGSFDSGTAIGSDIPEGMYWGLGGGLVKKFYFNRLHIGLEGLLSFSNYSFDGTDEYGDDWSWEISSLGFTLDGNLEVAVGYDWNIGAGVSYKIFAPSSDWAYTKAGTDVDLSSFTDVPELSFGGLGFQCYLTWSLPSLGYDPIKMARGAIGK